MMPGAGFTNTNKASLVLALWELQSIGDYGQVSNFTSAIMKAMRTYHPKKPPDLDSGSFDQEGKLSRSLLFFIRAIS